MIRIALAVLLAAVSMNAFADDDAKKFLEDAAAAYKAGDFKDAAELAEKAAKADPKSADGPFLAGSAYSRLRDQSAAITAFTEALKRDPNLALANDRRGDAYLKSGKWKEAIADFDVYLKANPKAEAEHWRRGIALYYAGRFEDGAKQFELHHKVNPDDVENSAWHFLCNSRATSIEKAREQLIPSKPGGDPRVPMKEVLGLFAGKQRPQDVIDAAENSNLKGAAFTSARFYAHLYVALYYESEKQPEKVFDHLTTAVEKYKIGDYMWDVADAHLKMLKAKK
jgi:lipoprotein NlpI